MSALRAALERWRSDDWLDPEAVGTMAAEATTEELLDAWALLREEFEAAALAIFARELERRGRSTTERDRARYVSTREREVLRTRRGLIARCRYCGRAAGRGLVLTLYVLFVVPVCSTISYYCAHHRGDVEAVTARLGRWLSHTLWGVRYRDVSADALSR